MQFVEKNGLAFVPDDSYKQLIQTLNMTRFSGCLSPGVDHGSTWPCSHYSPHISMDWQDPCFMLAQTYEQCSSNYSCQSGNCATRALGIGSVLLIGRLSHNAAAVVTTRDPNVVSVLAGIGSPDLVSGSGANCFAIINGPTEIIKKAIQHTTPVVTLPIVTLLPKSISVPLPTPVTESPCTIPGCSPPPKMGDKLPDILNNTTEPQRASTTPTWIAPVVIGGLVAGTLALVFWK